MVVAAALWSSGCGHLGLGRSLPPPGEGISAALREQMILKARVWSPRNIPAVDFAAGPSGPGAFGPRQWVECDYKTADLSGRTPKFECEVASADDVKVKYGGTNGEVFGEVLATRLFWGLGFHADRMYPVRVRCRGCPDDPWRSPDKTRDVVEFDPAAIERKLPGRVLEHRKDQGWKWSELDRVGPAAGPAARAQRDALKLLAVFVQHSDNKPDQQRLLCPPGEDEPGGGCRNPIMMVSDLGVTFGAASRRNSNQTSSVNLEEWASLPVWRNPGRCTGQLKRSYTGTMGHPQISEAGRKFLASLLVQLSDRQIHDLFDVARVERRARDPRTNDAPPPVAEWVEAFKRKRDQVVQHRCPR